MVLSDQERLVLAKGYNLAPRQVELLEAMMAGCVVNEDLAGRLGVTLATAKMYVHWVFRQMGVGSKAEAIAQAYQLLRSHQGHKSEKK